MWFSASWKRSWTDTKLFESRRNPLFFSTPMKTFDIFLFMSTTGDIPGSLQVLRFGRHQRHTDLITVILGDAQPIFSDAQFDLLVAQAIFSDAQFDPCCSSNFGRRSMCHWTYHLKYWASLNVSLNKSLAILGVAQCVAEQITVIFGRRSSSNWAQRLPWTWTSPNDDVGYSYQCGERFSSSFIFHLIKSVTKYSLHT